jgi:hypothetical protein
VNPLFLKKIGISIATTVVIVIVSSIFGEMGFGLVLGMYILPILLIYGVPVSVLSDFVTYRLAGYIRGLIALLIHLSFAVLFILIPVLISIGDLKVIFIDFYSLLDNYFFFFLASIISSIIFWFIDEFIRCNSFRTRCRKLRDKFCELLEKIGELKI